MPKINREELERYLNNGALLIDVRAKEEYQKNHINGAINIPINSIVDILNVEPNRNRVIILYCSMGKRSYIAARSLISLGYQNVYELDYK